MKTATIIRFAASALFLTGACSKASLPSEESNDPAPPGADAGVTPGQQSDWNAIEQLETQAKGIAKIEGCAESSDCRSAPVGSRACGGPRYYIPYCAKTTDSAALYRKLADIAKAEQAYNAKYKLVSTCEFRTAPVVQASGGSCVTK